MATTAGITSVITGVLAASILAQCPHEPGLAGQLAAWTSVALALAAGLLYGARNATGLALDHGADPALGGYWAGRAIRTYHAGMACLFAALAVAAVWRLALPHGVVGWGVAAIGAILALSAARRAAAPLPAFSRGRTDAQRQEG